MSFAEEMEEIQKDFAPAAIADEFDLDRGELIQEADEQIVAAHRAASATGKSLDFQLIFIGGFLLGLKFAQNRIQKGWEDESRSA